MWLVDDITWAKRWSSIKALVFDWDGVFNSGEKTPNQPSGFFEADSMGVNMLRFALWLRDGKCPPVAIITGADNPGARNWAEREHINACYGKVLNKKDALVAFCNAYGLHPENVCFFYDDILDLNAASIAGGRMLLGRPGAPHFTDMVKARQWADYISAQSGGQYGLRECCDSILAQSMMLEIVVHKRMQTQGDYLEYLTERNRSTPKFT
jgi:3-deoxy-D-manno-octulosonate 8-phosphate phosphatase (KDO 8-P phosphatase)